MREILFRGKRVDSGEWVEGHLIWYEDGRARITPRHTEIFSNESGESIYHIAYEVIPETIGQYTGLTDKNGQKIWEGDIVRQTFEKINIIVCSDWEEDEYGDLYGEDVGEVVVIPSKGTCIKNPIIRREICGDVTKHKQPTKMYKNVCSGRCEVIGTIHDNPELLGGDV